MSGNIFLILIVISILIPIASIPILLILFLNKKFKGYYWYSNQIFEEFWKKFTDHETFKFTNLTVSFKQSLAFAFGTYDIYINEIGIFIRASHTFRKKSGVLVFFQKGQMYDFIPGNYAVFKSVEEQNHRIIIYGESEKEIFNSSFRFEIQSTRQNRAEIKRCVEECSRRNKAYIPIL